MAQIRKNWRAGDDPWLAQILAGLLFSFTMLVFAPIDMYTLNLPSFWFKLKDFVPALLIGFVAVFALTQLVFTLLRLLPKAFYRTGFAVFIGLTLALYLQGNVLSGGNDVLAGGAPAWGPMAFKAILNACIWGAVLFFAVLMMFYKTKLFYKAAAYLCILLLIMQGASLAVSLMSIQKKETVFTTTADQLTYSQNGDVLIFMQDTLDTRLFDRILAENPEHLQDYTGFTYYRNTGGTYRKTDPSFVSILTGQLALNQEAFYAFCDKAFAGSTFFKDLNQNGLTVNIYGGGSMLNTSLLPQIQNLAVRNAAVSQMKPFLMTIAKMVAYRYAPFVFQPFLFDEYAERFNSLMKNVPGQASGYYANDFNFYRSSGQHGITVDNSRRFFKFYMRQGAHTPYRLNRYGQSVENDSVDMYEQTLGSTYLLGAHLKLLKEQGIYDSATIIITADHGYGDSVCNPMLLVKYPHSSITGIAISGAPTSLLDIRATALYGAKLDYEAYGMPVQLWEGVQERERLFYVYPWAKPTGYDFYLNELTEYLIPGDATDLDAYVPTGNKY